MPQVSPTSNRRRSGSRIALIVVAVAAVVLIGGVVAAFAWSNYTRSPQYSLKMLGKAVGDHDWDGFQRYVDVDAIANQAFDAAMSQSTKETLEKDDSGFGALGAALAQGIVQSLKPAFVEQVRTAIKTAITSEDDANTDGVGALPARVRTSTQVTVQREGDTAMVSLKSKDTTQALELRMKRVDDHWKVVAIVNIVELVGGAPSPGTGSPATGPETSEPQPTAVTARQAIEAFKAAGLPVGKVLYHNAATDPNDLLGRPGQYIEKANWADGRVEQFDPKDPAGGTVEVFKTVDDLTRRKDYIESISKSSPMFAGYTYAVGLVLLRLDKSLTPAQAAKYEKTLKAFVP